jgi:hypothetical protein
VNKFRVREVDFYLNPKLYAGMVTALGYDPDNIPLLATFSADGYDSTLWNSPEDWELILNLLPLEQI